MDIKKIINLFKNAEGYIGLNAAYANEIAGFLEGYERRAENLVDYNADLNNQLNKAEVHIEMLEKQKEAMLKELCDKEALVREAEGRFYELEKELDTLKNASKKQPEPEWISMEDERKPEEGESCIVRSSTGCITIRKYEKGGFLDNHRFNYWMHNPALPKPKELTFKDVFLEKFPKAPIDKDGIPKACIADVFPWAKHKHCDGWMCFEDWSQPYFEPQEEGAADAETS